MADVSCIQTVLLKVPELAVNKESISFQTDRILVDLWSSITRS